MLLRRGQIVEEAFLWKWRDRSIDPCTFPDYVTPSEFQGWIGVIDTTAGCRTASPRPSSMSKSKLSVWAWAWEYEYYTFLCKYYFFHRNYHYLQQKSEIKSTLWRNSGNYSVICVAICPWIFANCLASRCNLVHLRSECDAIPQSIVDGDAHTLGQDPKISLGRPRHLWNLDWVIIWYPPEHPK